ncbi:uncharacterized protein LOC127838122 [Dreissena polymorpha]|uniref:uncharacterized protein LOC127838122 n=1 Tax=Dreissena polymorpha TaxID=45954 RepID=UPI00226451B6|nr:uncharacterized protein LOC127838122 [Dreissena polymorpha]
MYALMLFLLHTLVFDFYVKKSFPYDLAISLSMLAYGILGQEVPVSVRYKTGLGLTGLRGGLDGDLDDARTFHGHIVNSGRSQQKSGDTVVFKENIALDVIRDGMSNMRKTLKRQYIPEQNVSGNILATALYMSSTEDMIYREEVLSDGKVISYALLHNNDSLDYINADGKILELSVDPDAFTDYITPPPVANNTDDRVIDTLPLRKPRIRRALSDQLTGAAVIKLILFIDKAAIDKFMPLNSDENAAREDLKRFFTLVVNEMTVMYQTLKTYVGVGYTRGTVTEPLQNFAVQLVDVQFPAMGSNFQFSANNDIQVQAGLDAFRTFIASYNSMGIAYDHAAWISGNDLVSGSNRGVAGKYTIAC